MVCAVFIFNALINLETMLQYNLYQKCMSKIFDAVSFFRKF